jgi:flagellar biosynthesis anti-sigma factor FlgM
MVTKINEARPLEQQTVLSTAAQTADVATPPAGAAPSHVPAATIDLSSAAQTTRSSGVESKTDSSDTALIQEIRQRIQNGTYQINHQQIAENILRDAVLAIRK